MRLTRPELCRLGLRALLTVPASPLLPLPAVGFQADDKSFSLDVPQSWQLDPRPPRAEQPTTLFRVLGSRADAAFVATVEPSAVKRLGELGSLDAVAKRYVASQPQPATLLQAAKVPRPSMFAIDMYELRLRTGSTEQVVRLGLQQSRMYKLAVTLPAAPSPELKAEAEALVQSYQAFPLNIGCLRESNAGTLLPGVCY